MSLIGLSSSYFGFRGIGIYNSVKRIAELGFNTVELGAGHVFEKNPFSAIKKIKADFPEMHFTVHGLFPPLRKKTWFNPSLGATLQNKKVMRGMFRAAEIVNAGCVTIHSGFLSEMLFGINTHGMNYGRPGKPIERKKAMAGIESVIKLGLGLSRQYGIKFGIENNTKGTLVPAVYSKKNFRELFEKFPEAGLLFDMGHALSEKRLEEMLLFKEKIIEMHVHFSRPKSKTISRDEHKALPSEEAIGFMRTIPQIKKIPLIFEHGLDVSEKEILAEKELLQNFLAKL